MSEQGAVEQGVYQNWISNENFAMWARAHDADDRRLAEESARREQYVRKLEWFHLKATDDLARREALLRQVVEAATTIRDVTLHAQDLPNSPVVTCPHGTAPRYPTHARWCDECWTLLDDALAAAQEVGDASPQP